MQNRLLILVAMLTMAVTSCTAQPSEGPLVESAPSTEEGDDASGPSAVERIANTIETAIQQRCQDVLDGTEPIMSAAQAYHGRGNDPRSIDIFSDQLITYHKALEEVPQLAGQADAIVEVVRALDRFQPDDLHIQDIDEVVLRTLRVATDASEVCYVILTGGSSEQRRDTFLDEQ